MKASLLVTALLGATSVFAQTTTTTVTTNDDGSTVSTSNSTGSGSSSSTSTSTYSYSYSDSKGSGSSNGTGKSKSRSKSSSSSCSSGGSGNSAISYSGKCGSDKNFDTFRNKVQEQLIADQLIKKGDDWSFAIDGNKFTVNGKKMDDDVYTRYKKIYEDVFGEPIGHRSSYAYSWSN